MKEDPTVDGRSREELYAHLREVAASYTEQWDPYTEDSGTTLMEVVSRYEAEVVERLDSVPEKHRLAFLDALDFSRRPPQSARVPLTFETTEDIDENVVVEGGTQALADLGDEEAIFELPQDDGFEATPSELTAVFSVDPTTDRVFDHLGTLEDEDEELATLFDGDDLQEHVLYLGHEDLLNLEAGSKVTLEVVTNASERMLDEHVAWEYYGEDPEAGEDDEDTEGWHALPQETSETVDEDADIRALMEAVGQRVREAGTDVAEDVDRPIELEFRVPAAITEYELDGRESRWIRGRAEGDEEAFFEIEIEAVAVSVERGGEDAGMEPDSVFQNDVPVDLDKDETGRDGGDVFPLGKFPQPPTTMYVASEEAFTKGGSTVDIDFAPPEGKNKREKVLLRGDAANAGKATGPVWTVEDLEDINQIREGDVVVTDMTTANMEPEIERAAAIVTDEGDHQSHAAVVGKELDIPVVVDTGNATEELEPEQTVTVDGDNGRVTMIEYLDEERDDEEEPDDEEDAYDDDAYGSRSSMLPGILGGPPELSWEYWDGEGWSRLRLLTDETSDLTEAGRVTFEVPEDLEEASVSGHDDFWIRARLVSGNYGQLAYEMSEEGGRGEIDQRPEPPRFHGISIQFGQSHQRFDEVVTYNNVSYRTIPKPEGGPRSFVPFEGLRDDAQTVYLGFSDRLDEGPIKVHVPMRDDTYPRSFDPSVRWEYRPDAEDGDWIRLDASDGTEGFTERGIVSLNFLEDTEPSTRFGEEHHWIRARVTGDEFSRGPTGPAVRREGKRTVEHKRDDSARIKGKTTPPALEGIHPNTQWAYNARTIEDEVLGSSDGTHDQEFTCYNVPVLDVELWVDELSMLTRKERRGLEDERPEDVERVPETGEPVEFWVRWEKVPDFLESGADSRHYRINKTTGTITFGDGQNGAIPPDGENNIRVTYETGGGSEGNVDRGAIEDLRTPISQIDDVTNLRQSDGGADAESLDTVVERAPRKIKNRDRAVTPRDYEEVAKAASRELAKTRCEPQRDDTGSLNSGYVTLLIVPRERRERPSPSTDLRRRVLEALRERAPATIVGPEAQRIIVRGPDYAEVSVETTLRTRGVESVSKLKSTVEDELDEYLHPLTGNDDGEGWAFGESPRLSGVTSLLEGIEGVETVRNAVMSVGTKGERIRIRDEAASPDLSWDTLVSTGTHDITVNMAGEHDVTVKMTEEAE